MPGFADIGDLLAGNHAGNEMAYQKGMALGATTQNAMAQARERIRQNTAIERLQTDPSLAASLGLGDMTDATITAMAGGLNPVQMMDTRLKGQEAHFRDIAGSPDASVDTAARNRALTGVATGPVKPFDAVGTKGYQDIYHPELGVQAIPGAATAGGGDAAAIQIMRAFGMLDNQGHVLHGLEEKAFDIMRSTQKTVDEGGVPAVISANPYARHGVAPTAAPPGASIGADMAPPVSAIPVPAPAAAAAAPPTARPAGPALQPVSDVGTVASNTAAIAKAKALGTTSGEKAAALPTTLGTLGNFTTNVDGLLAQPGFDDIYGNLQGTGIGQALTQAVSQDAANASAARDTLKADAFTVAIQKMRGLGALSNAEGSKVESALTRMFNPRISPAEARIAAGELKLHLQSLEATARREAGDAAVDSALGNTTAPAAAAAASGAMFSDPAKQARYEAWKAQQGHQ